jgi:hypothetical protein
VWGGGALSLTAPQTSLLITQPKYPHDSKIATTLFDDNIINTSIRTLSNTTLSNSNVNTNTNIKTNTHTNIVANTNAITIPIPLPKPIPIPLPLANCGL